LPAAAAVLIDTVAEAGAGVLLNNIIILLHPVALYL